jgi:hypothetical protein
VYVQDFLKLGFVPISFVLRGPGLLLAVLQPAKLVVYSCQAVGVAYLQLDKVYEHQLEAPAANMTVGPFGSAAGELGYA